MRIKTVVPTDDSLRIKTIAVEDCEPYVDCDNKHDSLLSLLKRCVVTLADGTYALQVCYGTP